MSNSVQLNRLKTDILPMNKLQNMTSPLSLLAMRTLVLVLPFAMLRIILVNSSANHFTTVDLITLLTEALGALSLVILIHAFTPEKQVRMFNILLGLLTALALSFSYSIFQNGRIDSLNAGFENIGSWFNAIPGEVLVFVVLPVLIFYVFGSQRKSSGDLSIVSARFLLSGFIGMIAFVTLELFLERSVPANQPWRKSSFLYVSTFHPMLSQEDNGLKEEFDRYLGKKGYLSENLRPQFAGGSAQNLLVINVDGVPGSIFELGAQSKVASFYRTRKILSERGVYYNNVYETSSGVSSGQYELACGLLKENTKTFEQGLSIAHQTDCLPGILRSQNMKTAFIDGKLRSEAQKIDFLTSVGYGEYFDESEFRLDSLKSFRPFNTFEFFSRAILRIKELRSRPANWFVTIDTPEFQGLTKVPDNWRRMAKTNWEWQERLDYLDFSFANFLTGLDSMGVLDDTLVLIVGSNVLDDVALTTSTQRNWVPLAVLGRGVVIPGVIREAYSKSDIRLSILDFFELRFTPFETHGRSLFRSYEKERAHFWVNEKSKLFEVYESDGSRASCNSTVRGCEYHRADTNRFLTYLKGSSESGHFRRTKSLLTSYFGSTMIQHYFDSKESSLESH